MMPQRMMAATAGGCTTADLIAPAGSGNTYTTNRSGGTIDNVA